MDGSFSEWLAVSMCRVGTTFALVSHSRCQAMKPNWSILGGTGSAILQCCNVHRATVTTATRWPNSSRHCPFYALVQYVPAPPTHPMHLGQCRTVCWHSQGCHRPSECTRGCLFDPESAEKWRGAAPLLTPLQRGDTPP